MNNASRRSLIWSQVVTAACAAGTGIEYLRWKHSVRPDAPVQSKIFLGMCVFFVSLFFVRLVVRLCFKNRDKRNYFAEEMDYRRSLTKDTAKS